MSTFFFPNQNRIEISSEMLENLKPAAIKSELKRSRYCLHHRHDDQVHEMIIAMHKSSYVRPHKHIDKSESFHIIEGELDVVFFHDSGEIESILHMGGLSTGKTPIYRLSSPVWHTVIPRTEFVIFHETTNGPFIKSEGLFADWAPQDYETEAVELFLIKIRKACEESHDQTA